MFESIVSEVKEQAAGKAAKTAVNLIIAAMWLFGAINTFLLSTAIFRGVSMVIYSLLLVASVDIALLGFKWAKDHVSISHNEIKWSRAGFWYTFAINSLMVVLYQTYFARGVAVDPVIATRVSAMIGVHIAAVSGLYYLWSDANPTAAARALRHSFAAKTNELELERLGAGLQLDTRKIQREIELVHSINAAQFDGELGHVTQYLPDHPTTATSAATAATDTTKLDQLLQLVTAQQKRIDELTAAKTTQLTPAQRDTLRWSTEDEINTHANRPAKSDTYRAGDPVPEWYTRTGATAPYKNGSDNTHTNYVMKSAKND